jgi:hypothetical protein
LISLSKNTNSLITQFYKSKRVRSSKEVRRELLKLISGAEMKTGYTVFKARSGEFEY